jgi:hypothetical protein
VSNSWRGAISTFALDFIVNLSCLFVFLGQLKFLHKNLNYIFEVKDVIFPKKLLWKVRDFLIQFLGSRKVYQKEKKKWGLSIKKIGDDVIAQK